MRGKNFIVCGLTGWCIEVFFTAISGATVKHDRLLKGHSSIWMFPIYGMASAIGDVYPLISRWPKLIRAFLYGSCIMCVEYVSGSLLTKFRVCPWNYTDCKYSVNGLIRLDYFPLWMLAGMLYERILKKLPR